MPSDGLELIRRIAGGDRDAFSAFYDAWAPLAFGVLRRILRSDVEAEEILHGAPATGRTFRAAARAALGDPFTVAGTAFKVELAQRTIVRILQDVSGVQS